MALKVVKYLAVHCAFTKESQDIGAKEIRDWHVRGNGWSDIGYHYVIRRNGTVEPGRKLNVVGAHVQGFNWCSVGICLAGGMSADGKPVENFTKEQMAALYDLLCELKKKFPDAKIQGHRDFPKVSKACPCFDAGKWFANFKPDKE